MSPSTDPDHTGPARGVEGTPSIAEVAALTRRLRELSAQGRAADPVERAAFLAEKDALLARITDPHRDPSPVSTAARESGPGRELHIHRPQLNRIAPAHEDAADGAAVDGPGVDHGEGSLADVADDPDLGYGPGDSNWWHPGGSARLDLPHPDVLPPPDRPASFQHTTAPGLGWLDQGVTVDTRDIVVCDPVPGETAAPYVAVEMPEWMREHAAQTAAAMAAGTAPPVGRDDPAELAARIAALRTQIAAAADEDTAARTDDDSSSDGAGDAVGDLGWSR